MTVLLCAVVRARGALSAEPAAVRPDDDDSDNDDAEENERSEKPGQEPPIPDPFPIILFISQLRVTFADLVAADNRRCGVQCGRAILRRCWRTLL